MPCIRRDLTGLTFNRWTVLHRLPDETYYGGQRIAKYRCVCECGNEGDVSHSNLTSTHHPSKSCGCIQKGQRSHNARDLVGMTFGYLTVTKLLPERTANHQAVWECICKCGKIHTARTGSLTHRHVASCGCKRIESAFKRRKDPAQNNRYVIRHRMPEHRFVYSQFLGRELYPEEVVHHKNGCRYDNRLENLELWTTSHPFGQRVEDKLAWAHELIDRYEPEIVTRGC